jgi:MYXO-CTERM domain-containing protein
VSEGTQLTFTAANWDQPQRVLVETQRDDDLEDDEAIFDVSSVNVTTHSVRIRVTDTGMLEPASGSGGEGGGGAPPLVAAGAPSEIGGNPSSPGHAGETLVAAGDSGAPGLPIGGSPEGGVPASSAGSSADDAEDDSGCGCRTAGTAPSVWFPLGLTLLVLGGWRQRRRARLESIRRS